MPGGTSWCRRQGFQAGKRSTSSSKRSALNNRKRRLRRHTETIEERFKRDRQALLPLPPTPYDACDKRTTRVTSLSLVRYRANDYSVPHTLRTSPGVAERLRR